MHGQPNIKICIAKQAKQIFQYKIKIKLHKNNAAIWHNKTCRIKQSESLLSGCARQSLAESDDTRGCICTICIVDLLMMSGLCSKHVEEFNFM